MSIRLAIISATQGATRKSFHLSGGKLIKRSGGQISEGFFTDLTLGSLEELPWLLQGMPDDQVLSLGVCDREGTQKLFTKEEIEKRGNQPGEIARTKEFIHFPAGDHLLMLDIDPDADGMAASWGEIIAAVPAFAGVAHVEEHASSSFIYGTDGTEYKGEGSRHIYAVIRGSDAELKKWLKTLFWALGLGRWELGKANADTGTSSLLERFPIDMAPLDAPERLIFTAPPKLGAGLEQRRPAPQYYPGGVLDVSALPPHSEEVKALAEANKSAARAAAAALRLECATEHIAKTKGMAPKQARKAAKQALKASDKGVLERSHKLYLANGTTITAGELGPDHHGVLLRDPEEFDYGGGRCCAKIYWGKGGIRIVSQAHGRGKKYRVAPVAKRQPNDIEIQHYGGLSREEWEALPWREHQAEKMREHQARVDALATLQTLSYPAERATEGEYLPQLPQLSPGAIHLLTAATGAGKTTRIREDWIAQARSLKWRTLILSPTNATGQQTARDADLPHIHDYGTDRDSQRALWADVTARGGLVMCPDSMHRLPDWFGERGLLLILDEANQVAGHLCEGNTLGQRYSEILEKFTGTARHAIADGAIVLAEANLPDRAVGFVRALVGNDAPVRLFTHKKQYQPWDCTFMMGDATDYRREFLDIAQDAKKAGEKLLYVTTSQREAKRMERALKMRCPGAKVIRIDSETNQQGEYSDFFENPDQWLQENQPDILMLSPSAKSGVSVEGGKTIENAYFSAVYGFFSNLATDTHIQLLGRYRPSVPRFIYCPELIQSSADESLLCPQAIRARLKANTKQIAGIYGLDDLLSSEGDVAELRGTIEGAVLDYVTKSRAAAGNQKAIAQFALQLALDDAGHKISDWRNCLIDEEDGGVIFDRTTSDLWKEIDRQLWMEEADEIASRELSGMHTPEWASKTLDSIDASRSDRVAALKVLWRRDFPGIDFDDTLDCFHILCNKYGAMAREVRLQARAENLACSKNEDSKEAEAILSKRIRASHRLPKNHIKAQLIADSGVLELLDGTEYHRNDPRCLRVLEWALKNDDDLDYWLRIDVHAADEDSEDEEKAKKKGTSPIQICHKLLKAIGYRRERFKKSGELKQAGAIKTLRREGQRGKNYEVFLLDLSFDPYRIKALEAARRRLAESVTSISKSEESSMKNDVTAAQTQVQQPSQPTAIPGHRVRWPGHIGEWVISAIKDGIARVKQVGGVGFGRAPLAELEAIAA
jgi:hypothetical protein